MLKRKLRRTGFIDKIKNKYLQKFRFHKFRSETTKNDNDKRLKLRKNYLPALVVILLLWIVIATLIFFTTPDKPELLALFFLLIFIAFFLTNSIVFANKRRGTESALGITLYLLLRYLGAGSLFNLLLLIGLIVCLELYLSKN